MARKKIDLTGQRFGKLVVLKEAQVRGIHKYWLCQCDCGSDPKEIRHDHLRGGQISCGCARNEGKHKVDLSGRKFGKLTAIAPTDKRKNGKVVWECKCDCGNPEPALATSSYLLNGDTQSCGCLKKEQDLVNLVEGYENSRVDGVNTSLLEAKIRDDNTSGHKGVHYHRATNKWFAQLTVNGKTYRSPTFEDKQKAIEARVALEEKYHKPYIESRQLVPGTRFGKLTVIEKSHNEVKNGNTKHYYSCKCDCGDTTTVEYHHLLNGNTKSCGCLRRRKANNETIDDFMLLGEAVRRWNITSYRLKDRIKVAKKNGKMDEIIEKGWAKYSVGERESGTWILSKSLLEHWYGTEPNEEENVDE